MHKAVDEVRDLKHAALGGGGGQGGEGDDHGVDGAGLKALDILSLTAQDAAELDVQGDGVGLLVQLLLEEGQVLVVDGIFAHGDGAGQGDGGLLRLSGTGSGALLGGTVATGDQASHQAGGQRKGRESF